MAAMCRTINFAALMALNLITCDFSRTRRAFVAAMHVAVGLFAFVTLHGYARLFARTRRAFMRVMSITVILIAIATMDRDTIITFRTFLFALVSAMYHAVQFTAFIAWQRLACQHQRATNHVMCTACRSMTLFARVVIFVIAVCIFIATIPIAHRTRGTVRTRFDCTSPCTVFGIAAAVLRPDNVVGNSPNNNCDQEK